MHSKMIWPFLGVFVAIILAAAATLDVVVAGLVVREVFLGLVMLAATVVVVGLSEKTMFKPSAFEGLCPIGDTKMELNGASLTGFGQHASNSGLNLLTFRYRSAAYVDSARVDNVHCKSRTVLDWNS